MPRIAPVFVASLVPFTFVHAAPAQPGAPEVAVSQVQAPAEPVLVAGFEPEFALEARTATRDDGSTGDVFIAGPMRIMSPLPEGYPRPTAPGAMEIKAYPSVRRAELTVEASPRWGMNMAFFPLFRHIKDRDIAMTAPVEAEVPAMAQRAEQEGQVGEADASHTGEMIVSFLYRTGDMGELGQAEENVRVVDAKPVTVLALGIRGTMDNDRIEREIGTLYAWLEAQGQTNPGPDGGKLQGRWHAQGAPRILGYNGPDVRRGDQWWEVQVPVQWHAAPDAPAAAGGV
jgi:hypothetical protein